jgi:hypothetical protein
MVVRFVFVSVCPCVSRLPPVSFYRYRVAFVQAPRKLFQLSGCPRGTERVFAFPSHFLHTIIFGRVMLSGRVCEWVARKNDHANDPFANLGELPSPAAQGIGAATASAAGTIVAKSDRIQKANNRVYIPVQDCNASLFILSEKRWR